MASFWSQALQLIGDLYRPNGGARFPDQIDLSSPINVVHDVSREIELGTIRTDPKTAGYFSVTKTHVHAGADVAVSDIDPYDSLLPTWGIPGERWIWLAWYGYTATAAQIADAELVVGVPTLGEATKAGDILVGRGDDSITINPFSNTETIACQTIPKNAGAQLPFPVFEGGGLGYRSSSLAACSITLSALLWVGPVGVYPPSVR